MIALVCAATATTAQQSKTFPDRTLEKAEYDVLFVALKRLGPYPEIRSMPLDGNTYKCTFDKHGVLTKVEKLGGDGKGYVDFDGQLAEKSHVLGSRYTFRY